MAYKKIINRLNKNEIPNDCFVNQKEKNEKLTNNVIIHDDMVKDLLMLVGQAIEVWADKYCLSDLPKHIIFNQALSIINTLRK